MLILPFKETRLSMQLTVAKVTQEITIELHVYIYNFHLHVRLYMYIFQGFIYGHSLTLTNFLNEGLFSNRAQPCFYMYT